MRSLWRLRTNSGLMAVARGITRRNRHHIGQTCSLRYPLQISNLSTAMSRPWANRSGLSHHGQRRHSYNQASIGSNRRLLWPSKLSSCSKACPPRIAKRDSLITSLITQLDRPRPKHLHPRTVSRSSSMPTLPTLPHSPLPLTTSNSISSSSFNRWPSPRAILRNLHRSNLSRKQRLRNLKLVFSQNAKLISHQRTILLRYSHHSRLRGR